MEIALTQRLVSCVVPTYNSERYLAKALDSILAQTYRPFEIIVADDGSTDETSKIATQYGDKTRFVCQETAGPAATRNLGLLNAVGEFIAFLDADDLWHPEKLARQMARFNARPTLDACVTHVQMFWTDDMAIEQARYRGHPRTKPLPGYATTTLLAHRRLFDTTGEFNTSLWFADATDWFMRAAEQGAIIELLAEVLTYHRMHPTNLTRRRSEASREEFLKIVKSSLDRRRRDQ